MDSTLGRVRMFQMVCKAVQVAVLSFAVTASAAENVETLQLHQPKAKGDPVAGGGKIGICKACHGVDGNSTQPGYPKLAGQYADYLMKQISDFKSGMRKDPMMSAMIQSVGSDQDLRDIAAYYAGLERMSNGKWFPDRDGKRLYESLERGCVACHGADGKGFESEFGHVPMIGGQHKEYLVKQLKNFRNARRYNDPDGVMVKAASQFSDEEIESVAAYVSGL